MKITGIGLTLGLVVSLSACGSDDDENTDPPPCDVAAQTGCAEGSVCEYVEGEGMPTGCFAPLVLEGRVVRADAVDEGIEGARVVGRDVNGAPVVSGIALSGADGAYSLRVPATREADGTPVVPEVLLRADAAGFATFPSGLRVALPVDVAAPVLEGGVYRVQNGTTTIALDALPDASGLGSVSGHVLADDAGGALVVAGGASGIVDGDGSYVLFNVPAGDVEVRGYAVGLSLEPAQASVVADAETKDVDLLPSDAPLGSVSGGVSFVNAGAKTTSVVLVVESTFNETLARGEVPRGLRAYPVTGTYSFADVPSGDYVVLAAFENDDLVRDPDTSIGGTATQRISVGSENVAVDGFKITGALAVVGPGAEAAEVVTGDVSFEWADDSSEDGYEVTVLDTFGNEVWKDTEVPSVSGSKSVTLAYGGPALAPGHYQFRAVSWRDSKGTRTYISATEDLKGVFIIE